MSQPIDSLPAVANAGEASSPAPAAVLTPMHTITAPMSITPTAPPKIQFWLFDAVITAIYQPLPNIFIHKYRLDKPATFKAGQYVSVVFPGMKPAPFSIASSPEIHDTIELGVEIVGKVTTKMGECKIGDHVPLKGPFGKFLMGEEKSSCFLAGGVGITPFLCMMRWLRDTKQTDRKATLLYSCRTQEQFLWREELEEMMRECPNFRIVMTITREQPPEWPYKHGRIDEQMIRENVADVPGTVYYACGPSSLIEGMFTMLRGMGVTDDHLKYEPWH